MTNNGLFEKLHEEGLVSNESLQQIQERQKAGLLSVHWELKTLLYLGVVLLTTGLGIWVYENIDTIGHQAVLAFIALVSLGSFYYCLKKKTAFSWEKAVSPGIFFDYILLLGCLSFVSFIAYLQFAYSAFGYWYSLASFIPMVVLFFSAYYFDHLGVLSMAITNLAAWMGITVTPLHLLRDNDFSSQQLIYSGILLGLLLLATSYLCIRRNLKKHFEFTYANFGTHLLMVSVLAAMFYYDSLYLAWFLLLAGIAVFIYQKAIKDRSFYFILIDTLYSYVGISYVVVRLLLHEQIQEAGIYLTLLYFIGSAFALIVFLIRSNKKLKAL